MYLMLRLALLVCVFLLFSAPQATSFAQTIPSTQKQATEWLLVNANGDATERHENGFVAYSGKLYLIGGRGVKPVEIFDPSTNTWSSGASPPFQIHHVQAVVYNDLIYVVGAYTGTCCTSESGVSHVWTYNPQTNQWSQGHEIPSNRRRGSTGAVVYNDKIYIAGGLNGGHGATATSYNWFDEYDPVSGQWTTLPNAPRKRDHFHAVVHDGKLYLSGGRDSSDPSVTRETVDEIDVYDFGAGNWSTLPSTKNIPTPRGGAASVLYKGEILVIGGETYSQTLAHQDVEAFNPVTESWRTVSDLVVGRHGTQASVLNGIVYIAAGSGEKGGEPELDSIEKYEDTSIEMTTVTQSLSPGWNLIGLPLSTTASKYNTLYDDVDLENGVKPMTWNGAGYSNVSNLSTGSAYWLKIEDNASQTQNQNITGTVVNSMQIQLDEGWNMISGPSCDNVVLLGTSTSPSGAIPEGTLYSFDGGYQAEFSEFFQRGRLDQGIGYWVFASDDAVLTLDCGGGKTHQPQPAFSSIGNASKRFGTIEALDTAGSSRELMFGSTLNPGDSDAFNLPPRLIGEYFDVRFANNRRLLEENEGFVKLQTGQFPITMRFTQAPYGKTGTLKITEWSNTESIRSHELTVGESISILGRQVELLHFEFVEESAIETPDVFLLHGNYPNPFNPSTRIVFDLPETSDIAVEVYDMTGRQVYSQSISSVPAGTNHSHLIEANLWPAGVYLYRLTAHAATRSKTMMGRMILLK